MRPVRLRCQAAHAERSGTPQSGRAAMSWKVANLCAERIFGSPSRKQIIMFLADKASDDGSGIWCSKGTIQRHTELGESTVKRTITEFLREGILVESGRRPCRNGYTVIYRIVLAQIMALECSVDPDDRTGSMVNPVQPDPGTGATVDGVPGPERTPNHPETIHKPPTRRRAEAEAGAERIWAAYPADRQRGKAACLARIADALAEGLGPDDLLRAVQAYASESAGFTRSKVCFSDNWFGSRRWQPIIEAMQAEREGTATATTAHNTRLAGWVRDRSPMCRHTSPQQVQVLIAAQMVTAEQLRAAGLAR